MLVGWFRRVAIDSTAKKKINRPKNAQVLPPVPPRQKGTSPAPSVKTPQRPTFAKLAKESFEGHMLSSVCHMPNARPDSRQTMAPGTRAQTAAIASIKTDTKYQYAGRGKDRVGMAASVKLELRLHDKLGALRELGKHLGIAERHEIAGKDGGPIDMRPVRERLMERLEEIARRRAATSNGPQPTA